MSNETIYSLKNVTKSFGELTAVNDISLDIRRGEIFGIIGMSGAGKSTLVRTLNGLESVSSGKVEFEGKDLAGLSEKELNSLRHSIAMIFQNFNLLSQKTVLDNVVLPLKISGKDKAEQKQKALEMLKVVGLESKAKAYPRQLSGGQKQRVAIARALTMDPKVLLCDEATSALDPKITEDILKLLKSINETLGITIVIITHEMRVIEKICDRVGIIDEGRLVETGPVSEVFTNPKTDIAKRLIFADRDEAFPVDEEFRGKKIARIVFDGTTSTEPIVCRLTKETGLTVSILGANTRSVGGIGYGQMIIELPKDRTEEEKITEFFVKNGVKVTEVSDNG